MHGPARIAVAGLALALGLPLLQTAAAEEDESPQAAAPRHNPLGLRPVPASALLARRGGTQVFNDMKLRGIVADNEAVNVLTGSNVIDGGAFAGAAGMPMVIQNSGNNVLIQNATIVNVQVK
jgi:hypothetical protein